MTQMELFPEELKIHSNELPQSWSLVKIADVAETTSGGTPSRSVPEYYKGNIPWVKSGELKDNLIHVAEEHITQEAVKHSSAKLFPAGTPLVAMYGATVGKTGILGIDATTNQAICGIFPIAGSFIPRYMQYWLISQREYLISLGAGGAQPNINQGIVRDCPFPLAPLNEQRRIVEVIETHFTRLDAGVDALKRLRKNLERYKASVLKAACEGSLVPQDPNDEPASELLKRILTERRAKWEAEELARYKAKGQTPPKGWQSKYQEPTSPNIDDLPELPEGWEWATWEELSPRVTVGFVGKMADKYVEDGIPFLRGQNVKENRFVAEGLKFITHEFHREIIKSSLLPNDVVVTRSGSVGVTCVIPESMNESNCADLVIIKEPLGVLPHYGAYYMNSVAKARIRAGQVGIALTHFNTQSVASLPVPVPPVAEQKRIVAEVEIQLSNIDELTTFIELNLKRAERLRQAILKEAFSGRLVLQDPSDEPASELLKRIKAEKRKK